MQGFAPGAEAKASAPRILVLGVGNLLLKDDGIGVHVIRELASLEFPPNVVLHEAGTAGHQLLSYLAEVDHMIVIDSLEAGDEPGSVYRFTPQDVPAMRSSVTSLHQMSILEILDMARLVGHLPPTVIIGVQPDDITPWGTELTPALTKALPKVVDCVLSELAAVGEGPLPPSARARASMKAQG